MNHRKLLSFFLRVCAQHGDERQQSEKDRSVDFHVRLLGRKRKINQLRSRQVARARYRRHANGLDCPPPFQSDQHWFVNLARTYHA
jgi:hypothetical protein